MGGEFGDEDERLITRLENSQFEPNNTEEDNKDFQNSPNLQQSPWGQDKKTPTGGNSGAGTPGAVQQSNSEETKVKVEWLISTEHYSNITCTVYIFLLTCHTSSFEWGFYVAVYRNWYLDIFVVLFSHSSCASLLNQSCIIYDMFHMYDPMCYNSKIYMVWFYDFFFGSMKSLIFFNGLRSNFWNFFVFVLF